MNMDNYYRDNLSELLGNLEIVQEIATNHPTYDMSGNEFPPAYNLRNICWLLVEDIICSFD